MGAWGAGIWENDDALDVIGELDADSGWERLAEIFEDACEANGERDAVVLALADVIAAGIGRASTDLPEEVQAWVRAAGRRPSKELVDRARARVEFVLRDDNSELRQLWIEAGEHAAWMAAGEALLDRLGGPAGASARPPRAGFFRRFFRR